MKPCVPRDKRMAKKVDKKITIIDPGVVFIIIITILITLISIIVFTTISSPLYHKKTYQTTGHLPFQ